MNKLLLLSAMLCLCVPAITGCGPGETEVVAPVEADDNPIPQSQMDEYEKMMKEQSSKR